MINLFCRMRERDICLFWSVSRYHSSIRGIETVVCVSVCVCVLWTNAAYVFCIRAISYWIAVNSLCLIREWRHFTTRWRSRVSRFLDKTAARDSRGYTSCCCMTTTSLPRRLCVYSHFIGEKNTRAESSTVDVKQIPCVLQCDDWDKYINECEWIRFKK